MSCVPKVNLFYVLVFWRRSVSCGEGEEESNPLEASDPVFSCGELIYYLTLRESKGVGSFSLYTKSKIKILFQWEKDERTPWCSRAALYQLSRVGWGIISNVLVIIQYLWLVVDWRIFWSLRIPLLRRVEYYPCHWASVSRMYLWQVLTCKWNSNVYARYTWWYPSRPPCLPHPQTPPSRGCGVDGLIITKCKKYISSPPIFGLILLMGARDWLFILSS